MKTHNLEALFPPPELERITESVARAERTTSGEIVPYVVTRSDAYQETVWRAAAIVMGVVLLGIGLMPLVATIWMPLGVSAVAAIAAGAGLVAGIIVAAIPSLQRHLAGQALLTARVSQRAAQAFIDEEVFNTRHRTGILIFLSLLERRVIVLGDAGINAVVQQDDWNTIASTIGKGIRDGRPAEGLVEGIAQCGTLLATRGFIPQPDDVNELPNRLRLGNTGSAKEPSA